jgi:hypothetical protein
MEFLYDFGTEDVDDATLDVSERPPSLVDRYFDARLLSEVDEDTDFANALRAEIEEMTAREYDGVSKNFMDNLSSSEMADLCSYANAGVSHPVLNSEDFATRPRFYWDALEAEDPTQIIPLTADTVAALQGVSWKLTASKLVKTSEVVFTGFAAGVSLGLIGLPAGLTAGSFLAVGSVIKLVLKSGSTLSESLGKGLTAKQVLGDVVKSGVDTSVEIFLYSTGAGSLLASSALGLDPRGLFCMLVGTMVNSGISDATIKITGGYFHRKKSEEEMTAAWARSTLIQLDGLSSLRKKGFVYDESDRAQFAYNLARSGGRWEEMGRKYTRITSQNKLLRPLANFGLFTTIKAAVMGSISTHESAYFEGLRKSGHGHDTYYFTTFLAAFNALNGKYARSWALLRPVLQMVGQTYVMYGSSMIKAKVQQLHATFVRKTGMAPSETASRGIIRSASEFVYGSIAALAANVFVSTAIRSLDEKVGFGYPVIPKRKELFEKLQEKVNEELQKGNSDILPAIEEVIVSFNQEQAEATNNASDDGTNDGKNDDADAADDGSTPGPYFDAKLDLMTKHADKPAVREAIDLTKFTLDELKGMLATEKSKADSVGLQYFAAHEDVRKASELHGAKRFEQVLVHYGDDLQRFEGEMIVRTQEDMVEMLAKGIQPSEVPVRMQDEDAWMEKAWYYPVMDEEYRESMASARIQSESVLERLAQHERNMSEEFRWAVSRYESVRMEVELAERCGDRQMSLIAESGTVPEGCFADFAHSAPFVRKVSDQAYENVASLLNDPAVLQEELNVQLVSKIPEAEIDGVVRSQGKLLSLEIDFLQQDRRETVNEFLAGESWTTYVSRLVTGKQPAYEVEVKLDGSTDIASDIANKKQLLLAKSEGNLTEEQIDAFYLRVTLQTVLKRAVETEEKIYGTATGNRLSLLRDLARSPALAVGMVDGPLPLPDFSGKDAFRSSMNALYSILDGSVPGDESDAASLAKLASTMQSTSPENPLYGPANGRADVAELRMANEALSISYGTLEGALYPQSQPQDKPGQSPAHDTLTALTLLFEARKVSKTEDSVELQNKITTAIRSLEEKTEEAADKPAPEAEAVQGQQTEEKKEVKRLSEMSVGEILSERFGECFNKGGNDLTGFVNTWFGNDECSVLKAVYAIAQGGYRLMDIAFNLSDIVKNASSWVMGLHSVFLDPTEYKKWSANRELVDRMTTVMLRLSGTETADKKAIQNLPGFLGILEAIANTLPEDTDAVNESRKTLLKNASLVTGLVRDFKAAGSDLRKSEILFRYTGVLRELEPMLDLAIDQGGKYANQLKERGLLSAAGCVDPSSDPASCRFDGFLANAIGTATTELEPRRKELDEAVDLKWGNLGNAAFNYMFTDKADLAGVLLISKNMKGLGDMILPFGSDIAKFEASQHSIANPEKYPEVMTNRAIGSSMMASMAMMCKFGNPKACGAMPDELAAETVSNGAYTLWTALLEGDFVSEEVSKREGNTMFVRAMDLIEKGRAVELLTSEYGKEALGGMSERTSKAFLVGSASNAVGYYQDRYAKATAEAGMDGDLRYLYTQSKLAPLVNRFFLNMWTSYEDDIQELLNSANLQEAKRLISDPERTAPLFKTKPAYELMKKTGMFETLSEKLSATAMMTGLIDSTSAAEVSYPTEAVADQNPRIGSALRSAQGLQQALEKGNAADVARSVFNFAGVNDELETALLQANLMYSIVRNQVGNVADRYRDLPSLFDATMGKTMAGANRVELEKIAAAQDRYS